MQGRYFLLVVIYFTFSLNCLGQDAPKSEDELKEIASELFNNENYKKAMPLYAQLLSLYPKDAEYNFKYGASLLEATDERENPLKYLKFAVSRPGVDPLAYYFLGKAYHLSYNFSQAVKLYSRFEKQGSKANINKYNVAHQIEMCKNGNTMLRRVSGIQVLSKKVIDEADFFRVYDLEGIDGKIISKPEEFMTKEDKKRGDKSVMYYPNKSNEAFYSSYGKKGENGRDIYKIVRLGNNKWSDPVNVGSSINTPYDEDFVFIHPDHKTLYFASKGHNSIGGYDLFMSKYDESIANWSKPENLGFPFNSVDDDVLFITDKDKKLAYFASDRENNAGEFTVYNVKTDARPAQISLIKGKLFVDNSKLPQAKITVVNQENNQFVGTYTTDENGDYQIEVPNDGGLYKFSLETSDEAPIYTGIVNVPKHDDFEVLGQELRLIGSGENQQLVIKNIFDGSVDQKYKTNNSGPLLTSESLLKMAALDVNMTNGEIAEANKASGVNSSASQMADQNESSKNKMEGDESVTSTNNSTAGSSSLAAMETIANDAENKVQQLNNASSHLYGTATDFEQKANEKFKLANTQKQQEDGNWKATEKEGRNLALEAAISLQNAQLIDRKAESQKIKLNQIQQNKDKIKSISDNNEAQKLIAESKSIESGMLSTDELISEREKELNAILAKTQEKLKESEAKNKALKASELEIDKKLKNNEERLKKNLSSEELAEATKEQGQLKLDKEDLNYQIQLTEKSKRASANSMAMNEAEKNQLNDLSLKVKSNQLQPKKLSSSEKEQLVSDIKTYKDNNQFAYSSTSEETNNSSTTSIQNNSENTTTAINTTKTTTTNSTSENTDSQTAKTDANQQNSNQSGNSVATGNNTNEDVLTKEKDAKNINAAIQNVESDPNYQAVNATTSIDDKFSNFQFNNEYSYSNGTVDQELKEAKQALYAAKLLDDKANKINSTLYELPTVEERNNAFEEINTLKEASKQKQIEAAQKYAVVNEKEFITNEKTLSKPNSYNENFTSDSLDVVNLLDEGASNHFKVAMEIRADIKKNDRFSKKEAELQRAYDYEIMALKYQKEALSTFKSVEEQYQSYSNNPSQSKGGFVQTITNAEVLSVKSADEAKKRQEQLIKEAKVFYQKADSIQSVSAKVNDETEKSKLLASIKQLQSQAKEKENIAAQYGKRQEQIQLGLANQTGKSLGAGIYKPMSVDDAEASTASVTIEEDKASQIMSSKAYVEYSTKQKKSERLHEEATVSYKNAIELQASQQKLEFKAEELKTQARNTNDATEKQRLIKEARVINQYAARKNASIDSINNVIKIKNYLIQQEKSKQNKLLSSLPKERQAEIVYLTAQHKNDVIASEEITAQQRNNAKENSETNTSREASTKNTKKNINTIERKQSTNVSLTGIDKIPKQLTTSIFKTIGKDNSAYSSSHPIPKAAQMPEGLVYKVQVGAFRNPIPQDLFKGFAPLTMQETANGIKRYTAGVFNNLNQANSARNDIRALGYSDAFVVAYLNGKRISIDQARSMSQGNSTSGQGSFSAGGNTDRNSENVDNTKQSTSSNISNNLGDIDGSILVNSVKGLFYTVQLGVYSEAVDQTKFNAYQPLKVAVLSNGLKRYNSGVFRSLQEAENARENIVNDIPDCFVTAYFNGKRISITEAARLLNR